MAVFADAVLKPGASAITRPIYIAPSQTDKSSQIWDKTAARLRQFALCLSSATDPFPEFDSLENGGVHRQSAAHGSDALWEDVICPVDYSRGVRSPRHILPRRAWPPSVPRCKYFSAPIGHRLIWLSDIAVYFLACCCGALIEWNRKMTSSFRVRLGRWRTADNGFILFVS